MVKHITITVVAILLAVTIAVSSSPFHDGWAVKKSSNLITGLAASEEAEASSFWASFFKGLFQAAKEESIIDTEVPSTGNRMDDEPVAVADDRITDRIPELDIEDRIPCDIRLEGCKADKDALQAEADRIKSLAAVCEDAKWATEDALAACEGRNAELDAVLAKLRNPSPPASCHSWMSGTGNCNDICRSKNQQCYGAVIRDIGETDKFEYTCAPSNCYDQSTPACHPDFITGGSGGDRRIVRDCLCC